MNTLCTEHPLISLIITGVMYFSLAIDMDIFKQKPWNPILRKPRTMNFSSGVLTFPLNYLYHITILVYKWTYYSQWESVWCMINLWINSAIFNKTIIFDLLHLLHSGVYLYNWGNTAAFNILIQHLSLIVSQRLGLTQHMDFVLY